MVSQSYAALFVVFITSGSSSASSSVNGSSTSASDTSDTSGTSGTSGSGSGSGTSGTTTSSVSASSSRDSTPSAADDLEWTRHVMVDVSPSSLGADALREMALLGGAADTVEWYMGVAANARDQMRRRGVATSGAEQYEYEESLQFAPAEVWAHFALDGAAMNESVLPPGGGFGGRPTMTSIAPKWAEQVRQGLLRPALFGDCVTQDNVGAPLYGAPNGCCDVRSNALFVQLHGARLGLASNFSIVRLVSRARMWGVCVSPCGRGPGCHRRHHRSLPPSRPVSSFISVFVSSSGSGGSNWSRNFCKHI